LKGKIKENGNKLVLSLIKAERDEFDKVQRAEENRRLQGAKCRSGF
jgi:hypothetical protein